LLNCMEEESG